MLSIKHKTFITLNKYIEFNGIENVNPNEITTYDFSKQRRLNNDKNDISSDSANNCLSPISASKNTNQSCHSLFKKKRNDIKRITIQNNNLFSNKSLKNFGDNNYQPTQTEGQFSQLLNIMSNEKPINNNNNSIFKKISSFKNLKNKDDKNDSNKNINMNTNTNNNNENMGSSCRSLASNFFNDKQKTNEINDMNDINDRGNTIIMKKKSDILLPTLNAIFNDNKVEEIRMEMIKAKQKERKRKIFSLGKKFAKLLKNEKNIITNKIILDNIPDINTDEEYSFHHFDYEDLSMEAVTSFTLESIYKNINIHTKMKYLQNKIYQEKTLKFLTKLIENKTRVSSDHNSDFNRPSSFSYSITSKTSENRSSFSLNSPPKNNEILKLSNSSKENNSYNSERLFEIKKRRNKSKKIKKKNIRLSEIPRAYKNINNIGVISNEKINFDLPNKNHQKKAKKNKRYSINNNIKFTFKLDYFDNHNEKRSINTNSIKKKHKIFPEEDKKNKKNTLLSNNNCINLQTIKSSKSIKKRTVTENKSNIKKKNTRGKSKPKIELKKTENNAKENDKKDMTNTMDYLAKDVNNENECILV